MTHASTSLDESDLREQFTQAAARRRTLFAARDALSAAILSEADHFTGPSGSLAPSAASRAPEPASGPIVSLPKPPQPKTWWERRAAAARQRKRREAILAARLFDATWYRARNLDVASAGMDPLAHFLEHGSFEGRSPGPGFDAIAYLARYPDVMAGGLEPWVHYTLHGKAEGRVTQAVPSSLL
ncbi:hypothetical protein [Methylobacterium sp. WL120]|uniref:hypothetical protein n=1 Tax=Methylobacterium sp. WL120 TaxID=2603887 RepID=UPI0011C77B9F|nr:hypothetical protein [Methylobacterium sp. WL120]TXM65196.1 hypothetical protein FV229_16350 [Methylobacterium sp. WL120]